MKIDWSNPTNPAELVVARFGGVRETAAELGVARAQVYRWFRAKAEGGTGGLIPSHHQVTLLRVAARRGIPLAPDDFFFGLLLEQNENNTSEARAA